MTRPTTKTPSILALALSSLLVIAVVALYGMRLVANAPLNAEDVESAIEAWYLSDSGAQATVDCPVDPPSVTGSAFLCSAHLRSGQVDTVEVHVQNGSFTWKVVTR